MIEDELELLAEAHRRAADYLRRAGEMPVFPVHEVNRQVIGAIARGQALVGGNYCGQQVNTDLQARRYRILRE